MILGIQDPCMLRVCILEKKKSKYNLPGLFCDTLCPQTFQLKGFQMVSSLGGSVILRQLVIISLSSFSLIFMWVVFLLSHKTLIKTYLQYKMYPFIPMG